MNIVRETPDDLVPRPSGDFDGVTRRDVMKALLDAHEEPQPVKRLPIAARLLQYLTIAGVIWAGPKLTPAQAADILRDSPALSNRTHVFVCTDCGGPFVASTGASAPTAGPWNFPRFTPTRPLSNGPYVFLPYYPRTFRR
jgi:hypothetical protein